MFIRYLPIQEYSCFEKNNIQCIIQLFLALDSLILRTCQAPVRRRGKVSLCTNAHASTSERSY